MDAALPLSPSLNDLSTTYDDKIAMDLIPESHKYAQNYRVTRVKNTPIDITEESARVVFEQIMAGAHAIVLGKHLVMCSNIASIDPLPIKNKPEAGHYKGDVWIKDVE